MESSCFSDLTLLETPHERSESTVGFIGEDTAFELAEIKRAIAVRVDDLEDSLDFVAI